MDNFEANTGQQRPVEDVVIERGNRNTPDYLRRVYALPSPYTADEYVAALGDFDRRYTAGERTEE